MKLASIIWTIWLQLAPWMLVGAVAAGVLHAFIPNGWFRRQLSGNAGVLKAVLVGIPLPLCSCGVIPVGLGLKRDGASSGASVGFLISTPQTGVDSLLISATFLGWPFALLKVVVAAVTGLLGGLVANFVQPESVDSHPAGHESPPTAARQRWKDGISHGLQLIRSIWKWLVAGVLISAVITWLVPQDVLAEQAALQGPLALLLTLVISLPLYVCATASVPIAAALVASGFPPGAALVFLMAGPATNVATLGAVYRTLGLRVLAVYLTAIIAGSLAAGLAFNQVIAEIPATEAMHTHGSNWVAIGSGILLAALMVWFAIEGKATHQHAAEASAGEPVFVSLGTNISLQNSHEGTPNATDDRPSCCTADSPVNVDTSRDETT